MWFKRERREELVREGAVFQRKHSHNVVETAKVVSVQPDRTGIPHVWYEVSFARRDQQFPVEARLLSVTAFADHYPESVTS